MRRRREEKKRKQRTKVSGLDQKTLLGLRVEGGGWELKGWEDIWFVCFVVVLVRPSFQPWVPHIGYACTCPVVQGAVTVLREFLPSTVVFERTEECEWTTPSTQAHKVLTHSHIHSRVDKLFHRHAHNDVSPHTQQHNTHEHTIQSRCVLDWDYCAFRPCSSLFVK